MVDLPAGVPQEQRFKLMSDPRPVRLDLDLESGLGYDKCCSLTLMGRVL